MVRLNKLFAYFICGASVCLLLSINSPVFVHAKASVASKPVLAQAQPPSANPVTTTPDSSLPKPPPHQGKPVAVSVGVYISNLDNIDQATETYKLSGYLSAKWTDPRLIFNPKELGVDYIAYKPGEIWEPYLTKVNAVDENQPNDVALDVKPDGTVQYSERFDVTLSGRFHFSLFPFDSQMLQMIIESFEYDKNQVIFLVDKQQSGWGEDEFLSLSEWQIRGFSISTSLREYVPDKTEYSRVTFGLKVKRNPEFYIWKILLPLLLIDIISWSVFWIDAKKDFGSQIGLGMTSLLTAIAYSFTISNILPRVAYLTLIDSFILLSYIFIFSLICVVVLLHYFISFREQPDIALAIQKKCRWIYPLGFVVVNLLVFAFLFLSQ